MLALGAVEPHRLCVLDHDSVGGRVSGCGRDGHEARVDTGDVGVHGNRLARLVEGGLCDGVICRRKLKLHHVAFSRGKRVRGVLEGSICAADFDDMDGDTAGGVGCKGAADAQSGECESSKVHDDGG